MRSEWGGEELYCSLPQSKQASRQSWDGDHAFEKILGFIYIYIYITRVKLD